MRRRHWLILGLTLLAFFLRVYQLDMVPPGFRDDELINNLVISQKVLDGEWAVYYPDASGHEALYHALNAITNALVGRNAFGLRLVSVMMGTLLIPLLYQVGRRMFNRRVALLAAALLAVSFWGLMYSRTAIRHVGLPFFALPAFYAFWHVLDPRVSVKQARRWALLAALCMGLALYVYFAARGLPLIPLAFLGYKLIVDKEMVLARWRSLGLMFLLTGLLALPLVFTLAAQPEAEGRVAELAVPLVAAAEGDLVPLRDHIVQTLSMFHATGDPEWLYNISGRPVFGPLPALLFWAGVGLSLYLVTRHLFRRRRGAVPSAHAFLLLWWLAGIAPAFISIPPSSLSHTILALPPTFLLLALPLSALQDGIKQREWLAGGWQRYLLPGLAVVLVALVALRDLPAYFDAWPHRGNVRFLYHADVKNVAQVVDREYPAIQDFGISGLLAGPWNRLALEIELAQLGREDARPRWFNPERAILMELAGETAQNFNGYPLVTSPYAQAYANPVLERAGGYRLNRVNMAVVGEYERSVCFENGLCAVGASYNQDQQRLHLTWRVGEPLSLPPMPLISNPPPPGVYAGPRLAVFAHLLDDAGEMLAADDGLWVDPQTLYPGDMFQQIHLLPVPESGEAVEAVFGLYDPMSGERILTNDGRDQLSLPLEFGP